MRPQLLRITLLIGISSIFVGCGGTAPASLVPVPKQATEGTLAGATCQAGKCQCADAKNKVGVPENKSVKRFEIKIGPIRNKLWVKVGDTLMYKDDETATQCFYVDLPEGKHPVMVRGTGEHGFAARVHISEMATKEVGWYDTFYFHCGGVDTCDADQLKEFGTRLDKYKRNIHDPCGSTKVLGVSWKTGKLPDNLHPNNLQLDLTLQVYPFTPKHPPGHKKCAGKY